jgi:hypothetical protein
MEFFYIYLVLFIETPYPMFDVLVGGRCCQDWLAYLSLGGLRLESKEMEKR